MAQSSGGVGTRQRTTFDIIPQESFTRTAGIAVALVRRPGRGIDGDGMLRVGVAGRYVADGDLRTGRRLIARRTTGLIVDRVLSFFRFRRAGPRGVPVLVDVLDDVLDRVSLRKIG